MRQERVLAGWRPALAWGRWQRGRDPGGSLGSWASDGHSWWGVRRIPKPGPGGRGSPLASHASRLVWGPAGFKCVFPRRVCALGELEWPERGPQAVRAWRPVPSVGFVDRAWNRRSQVGRPRPAPLRRRAAGQLCLGLGSPDICGLPSPRA